MNRYEKRIQQLREAMAAAGVDAALLTPSGDTEFVTGLRRPRRESVEMHTFGDYLHGVLITPDHIVTIVPYLTHLSVDPQLSRLPWLGDDVIHLPDGDENPAVGFRPFDELVRAAAGGGRSHFTLALPKFALAMTAIRLGERYPEMRFTCTEDLVSPLRMVKDPEDLEAMRVAARMADDAFRNVVDKLHPGIHEADVYHELDWQMRLLGADGNSFSTDLLTGRPGRQGGFGAPADTPLGNQLTAGWVLAFDFGFIANGWCSDFGRTVYFGEPTEEMRRAHYLVMEAQRLGMEAMVGGRVTAAQVDAAARSFLVEANRGHEFIHRLGHSIGVDVHEHPFLCGTDNTVLQNGMTFTVEPSLWVNREYFVRVEDVVVVTPEGGVSLNVTPTFDMIVIE